MLPELPRQRNVITLYGIATLYRPHLNLRPFIHLYDALAMKVGIDPMGKYEKLPPAALLESLDPQPTIIDQDELSRAEWLWNRRAIVLSENLSFFFFYLTVLVCLLYLVPDTILFLLLWIVAGASCAAVDRIRLDRWRNQYESSIKRVVNAVSERK